MLEKYNQYNKRQENGRLKEKFFEFILFLRGFYKEHLKENQYYIVQAGAKGAAESRVFSIIDRSKGEEKQFTITYFVSVVEEESNRIEMNFSKKITNDYTKALEEIIKEFAYKTKNYFKESGYFLKRDQIDNIILKITNDIDLYVDSNKYNL